MENPWKTFARRYVFELLPFVKVRRDLVIQPDGKRGKYVVVERPDTVVIIPQTSQKEIFLVKQWRYPLGKTSLELPMGMINKGEPPKTAALREMEEEIGYKASNLLELGRFCPSSGLIKNMAYVFLAKGLEKTTQRLDPTEKIIIKRYPLKEILSLAKKGVIKDGFTIASLWYYQNKLNNQ